MQAPMTITSSTTSSRFCGTPSAMKRAVRAGLLQQDGRDERSQACDAAASQVRTGQHDTTRDAKRHRQTRRRQGDDVHQRGNTEELRALNLERTRPAAG